jgi:anti-sigma B factor antagonist
MSNLRVQISKKGAQADIAVVQIYGAVDTLAAYTFQEQMNTLMKTGVYKYIIDLENLEYISSAGIGIFSAMDFELQKHHGRIVFVCISKKIYKLFDMIGLTAIFEIKDTVEKAIEEFEPDA